MRKTALILAVLTLFAISGKNAQAQAQNELDKKVNQYASYTLHYDINQLEEYEKELLGIFIDISRMMDEIFWEQSFGNDKNVLYLS